ncbi:MAG: hypothetical protein M1383_00290 [Patescibacteria group bacterium]|nr:hypothetical protein [Patescibacteria group bacterium]
MLNEIENILKNIPPADRGLNREVEGNFSQLFDGHKDSLVSSAISAEKRALHWDDENRNPKMHVGCSILTLGKKADLSKPDIYTGANSKPEPGDMVAYPNRKCAEMNALENAFGEEYEGKIKPEPFEEMEKEDVGVVAAIVTVSPSENTGETDTINHKIVYSCKQCVSSYKVLMEKGILTPKTIVYNARTKDGTVVAGEPVELGILLEKNSKDEEAKNAKTIEDLFQTISKIKASFYRQ